MTNLSLTLIQEGLLSVTGERGLVNCVGGLPRLNDRARNDLKVPKGRKTPTEINNMTSKEIVAIPQANIVHS